MLRWPLPILLSSTACWFASESAPVSAWCLGLASAGGFPQKQLRQVLVMMPDHLTEWHNADVATQLRIKRRLLDTQTPFQRLEVVETEQFGHAFLLDGHLMSAEGDEWFYHENLNQLAAMTHPSPRSALIIGGGDGGSARQLLMQPSIERIVVCELDAAVIEMARRYLLRIHQGSLDDPRVEIVIGDGFDYVARSREPVDLLVLDLTDPQGLAAPLYSRHFFAECARLLGSEGILCLHLCSPQLQPQLFMHLMAELSAEFACVRPILVPVLLYGGLWSLACASQSQDPKSLTWEEITRRLMQRQIGNLHYYNADTHAAVLAVPNFVRELLPSACR